MKNKKIKNKTSTVLVVLIIVIVFGIIAYTNRSNFVGSSISGRTVFNFDTGQQYKFESQRSYITALCADGIVAFNQNGRKTWDIQRQTSNPRMQNEEGYTLLFDKGNNEISAYNDGAKMWERSMEQPIITAKINAKGFAAVVSYEIGYKGKIEILNSAGELIYMWQLGENYVVDVDISPDCRFFAAAAVLPAHAKLTSKVAVVDIDAESIIGETVREDTLIVEIKYQSGGSLVALGEDELVGISSRGEQRWVVDFGGRQLQKAILPYNTSCVLTFAGSRNNSVVEVYNREGQKTGEYISDRQITAIDVFNNSIVLAEKRNIIMMNLNGRVSAQTEFQREIKDVMLMAHGNVAVVGNNSVDIIKP